MGNDLNTSMGVTAIFDVLKAKANDATKLALITDFDQVLSLGLIEKAAAKRSESAAQSAKAGSGAYTISGEGDPAVDALVLARYELEGAGFRRGGPHPGGVEGPRASKYSPTPRTAPAGNGCKDAEHGQRRMPSGIFSFTCSLPQGWRRRCRGKLRAPLILRIG